VADNRQWLDVGLAVLAASGADALTIDRLAREVGLSKGSFYHHFGGMAGYRTALLAHYQATFTTQYIDAVEHGAGAPAREQLQRLMDLVCADDDHGSGPTTSAGLLEELTGDPSMRSCSRGWSTWSRSAPRRCGRPRHRRSCAGCTS
jgi:AcrR family transcriptional regulator